MMKPNVWSLIAAAAWIGSTTMVSTVAHANDRRTYTTSTGAPTRDGRFTGKRVTPQPAVANDTTPPGDHRSLAGNAADYSTSGRTVQHGYLPSNARGGGPTDSSAPVAPAPTRVNK